MEALDDALALNSLDVLDHRAAQHLDEQDELAPLRAEFEIPTLGGMGADIGLCQSIDARATSSSPSLYFCGNSLGPLARRTRKILSEELDVWSQRCAAHRLDCADFARSARSTAISSTLTAART